MKRGGLKPSAIVPVSSKLTVYENYLLGLLASKCGVTKSSLVRLAILRLFKEILDSNKILEGLTPGYYNMLKILIAEADDEYVRCINKLK